MEDNEEKIPSAREYLRDRVKKLKEGGGISDATPMHHSVLKMDLYPCALSYDLHDKLKNILRLEDLQHANQKKGVDDPKDTSKSDMFLMTYAVYLEDGTPLGKEMAAEVMALPKAGPDNFRILQEAIRVNPPREYLVPQIAALMSKSAIEVILWKMLIQGGLIRVLVDYASTHSTPEERAFAERELVKFEEVVEGFAPYFYAEELVQNLKITWMDAMSMVAASGSSDSAMEEVRKLSSEEA